MKVAIANSSRIWGGGEVMTARLARGLVGRGHEVVVLGRRKGSLFPDRLPDIRCERTLGGFDLNPVAIGMTIRALRRHRPDVVMTITHKDPRTAGPAARALGIPVVVRQGVDAALQPRLHHRFYYGWLPACLVAPSRTTRDTMIGSVPWLEPGDVAVIVNGVDVERIAGATPAELGLPAGAVAIGYLSRHEEVKGIRDLLAAWPRIAASAPDAHLVLVDCGGRLRDEVRRIAAALPRIHWVGFSPDVGTLMRATDLVVMPSHSEGFGLVVAEAMAAGVPVAVSGVSSLVELVTDGIEGRYFEPRDPASLARVVTEMALDPEMRRRMGEAGHRRAVSAFSYDRMMDEYEELLKRVAGRGSADGAAAPASTTSAGAPADRERG
jgi:glycosyltransferase involved in cell wall biosynthesis